MGRGGPSAKGRFDITAKAVDPSGGGGTAVAVGDVELDARFVGVVEIFDEVGNEVFYREVFHAQ